MSKKLIAGIIAAIAVVVITIKLILSSTTPVNPNEVPPKILPLEPVDTTSGDSSTDNTAEATCSCGCDGCADDCLNGCEQCDLGKGCSCQEIFGCNGQSCSSCFLSQAVVKVEYLDNEARNIIVPQEREEIATDLGYGFNYEGLKVEVREKGEYNEIDFKGYENYFVDDALYSVKLDAPELVLMFDNVQYNMTWDTPETYALATNYSTIVNYSQSSIPPEIDCPVLRGDWR